MSQLILCGIENQACWTPTHHVTAHYEIECIRNMFETGTHCIGSVPIPRLSTLDSNMEVNFQVLDNNIINRGV